FFAVVLRYLFYHIYLCFHFCFFFFNATPPTEIYTLSLHDALPISATTASPRVAPSPFRGSTAGSASGVRWRGSANGGGSDSTIRSEEHTSELQSRGHLVCRLLLEKKKINKSLAKIKSLKAHTSSQS